MNVFVSVDSNSVSDTVTVAQSALLTYPVSIKFNNTINQTAVMFTLTMREILHGDHYKKMMQGGTFDQYCASNFPRIKPATIRKYISTLDWFIDEKKIKVECLYPHPMNKLGVIKSNANDPKKWLDVAAEYPISDFTKQVLQVEKGIKPDDKEVENYIKQQEKKQEKSGCPLWVNGKCKENIC